MYAKVLAHLLPQRLLPAKKFPQLRLRVQSEKLLSRRPFELSFDVFDKISLNFISREVDDGNVIEIRRSNLNFCGLGFFEPSLGEVQVFQWFPPAGSHLLVDEQLFIGRLEDAIAKREKVIPNFCNTFRLLHGAEDGIPSMFIDQFSERFYTIDVKSFGADRLLPPVVEFLRRRGAEEVIIQSPSIPRQCVTLAAPSLPLPSCGVENGISFSWLAHRGNCPPSSEIICPAYRRSRLVLREMSSSKRVLCIHDRQGLAALNAILSATKVVLASEDKSLLDVARANILMNHGAPVFQKCETSETSVKDFISSTSFDIVLLEHHETLLSSSEQWKDIISHLIRHCIIKFGSILITCHQSSKDTGFLGVQRLVQEVCKEQGIKSSVLRSFAESVDFPKTASRYLTHFSHIFLVE